MALVADGLEPLKVTGARMSDNFFTTLGVRAAVGRTLQPGDSAPAAQRVVVIISCGAVRAHFGSNPAIIGRIVRLDGVAAPDRRRDAARASSSSEPGTDVWAPLSFDPASPQLQGAVLPGVRAPAARRDRRRWRHNELQALLPDDAAATWRSQHDWGRNVRVESLQDAVVGDVRPTLLILLAAVG